MRVLVIGAGRMGAIRVEDLVSDPRVSEVLIANRNSERATELASRFQAKVASWEELETVPVDAFIVAVGTDAHDAVLRRILPRGLPVLCEKPVALTLEDTRDLIELANTFGSELQIGFQRRFDPAIRSLRNAIVSGEVGILYTLSMTSHDHTPSPKEFIAGSGGIFRDLMVHDFDLIRWLTDSEVETVFAQKGVQANHDYSEFDDADVATVMAKTFSGVQVVLSGTRHQALGHDVRLEVHGSKNSLAAGTNQRTPLQTIEKDLALNSRPYTGFVDRFREAFLAETSAFVSFVAGEIENPCPADSAIESLRLAFACEQSVRTGGMVKVSSLG